MNNEMKTDILGAIKYDYIASAAQKRMEFKNRPGKRINFKAAVLLAAALALISAMVFALPALIKDEPRIPVEYSYLDDLPAVELSDSSMKVTSSHIRPTVAGIRSETLDIDKIYEFFGISELPMQTDEGYTLESVSAMVTYEPWEEVHDIVVTFNFDSGNYATATIDPKKRFDFSDREGLIVTVGDFSVLKTVNTPTPGIWVSTFTDIEINMQSEAVAISLKGDKNRSKELELIYNFLLNAEFNFKSIASKDCKESLTYFILGEDIPCKLIEDECENTSEYIREPKEGYTFKEFDKDELDRFFKKTNKYIKDIFAKTFSDYDASATYDSDGELHSVFVRFYIGKSKKQYIGVIIDPNAALDLEHKETAQIGEYKVAVTPYYKITEDEYGFKEFEPASALGYMQSEDAAILMRAEKYTYLYFDKLINFIVYSDLNFKALEN